MCYLPCDCVPRNVGMHYWLQESLLCAEHIFLQQCAGLSAFPSQPIFRCTADNALLAIGKTAHFTRTTNKPPILLCGPVLKGHVGTKSALTHTKKKKHVVFGTGLQNKKSCWLHFWLVLHLCRYIFVVLKTFSGAFINHCELYELTSK